MRCCGATPGRPYRAPTTGKWAGAAPADPGLWAPQGLLLACQEQGPPPGNARQTRRCAAICPGPTSLWDCAWLTHPPGAVLSTCTAVRGGSQSLRASAPGVRPSSAGWCPRWALLTPMPTGATPCHVVPALLHVALPGPEPLGVWTPSHTALPSLAQGRCSARVSLLLARGTRLATGGTWGRPVEVRGAAEIGFGALEF